MNYPNRRDRLSFDAVTESYDRSRPGYPAQAFEDLFSYVRQNRPVMRPQTIEIGPGTGQATRSLLERGAIVTAIEIGPRLATFLAEKFAGRAGLRVINDAFEDVNLPEGAFALVLAATSFHWVDPAVRIGRAHAFLRPGGVVATLSTLQIRSEVDRGYFDRTFSIYRHYRPDEPETVLPAEEEVVSSDHEEFRASGLFQDVITRRYRWDQTYTTDQYEHLLRSYSSTQVMPQEDREALIRDLREVIDREYGGTVVRPLVIALTMGRRR